MEAEKKCTRCHARPATQDPDPECLPFMCAPCRRDYYAEVSPRCQRCGHACPQNRSCEECGSAPMATGDKLCRDCDDKLNPEPPEKPAVLVTKEVLDELRKELEARDETLDNQHVELQGEVKGLRSVHDELREESDKFADRVTERLDKLNADVVRLTTAMNTLTLRVDQTFNRTDEQLRRFILDTLAAVITGRL